MATATLHLESVGGFAGVACCYRLDPPAQLDGREREYVTLSITPKQGAVPAEIRLYPATVTGSGASLTLAKRVGSFALRDDYTPGDAVYEDGIRALSLMLLGGYVIEPQDAT